ncbi:MAG: hypothetical protein WC714_15445 [Candidatus Obscuribacterales bacterium]
MKLTGRQRQIANMVIMSGGYLLLLSEIRFEHRAALIGDWRPWLPIALCLLMVMAIPLSTWRWHQGGRTALLLLNGAAAGLGLIGLYFHSGGHVLKRLFEVFSVWTLALNTSAAVTTEHPPLLAPLALVGLGLIGTIFCAEFDSSLIQEKQMEKCNESS